MPHSSSRLLLIFKLSRYVINSWARKSGFTFRQAVIGYLFASVFLFSAAFVAVLIFLPVSDDNFFFSPLFATPLLLTLFLGGSFFGLLTLSLVRSVSRSFVSLTHLPIETRLLTFSLSLPIIVLSLTPMVCLSPIFVRVISVSFGRSIFFSLLLISLVWLTALACGHSLFLVFSLLERPSHPTFLVPFLSIASWLMLASASIWSFHRIAREHLDSDVLHRFYFLLWPAFISAASSESVVTPLVALAALLGLCVFDWFLFGSPALLLSYKSPVTHIRVPFSLRGRLLPFRLETIRLLRNDSILSWLASAVLISSALLVLMAQSNHATRSEIAPSIAFFIPQMVAYPALFARGLSQRERPYPLLVGFSPFQWSYSLLAAAFTISLLCGIPFLAGSAVLSGQLLLLPLGVIVIVWVTSIAGIIGFVLMPNQKNAGGELVGFVLTLLVTTTGGMLVSYLTGSQNDLLIVASLGGIGLAISWIPGYIETRRWNVTTGISVSSRFYNR